MRKPFPSQVSEQLAMAFDIVDATSAQLDKFKETCHESERHLTLIDPAKICEAITPVPPAPANPPAEVKPPPYPTIYSIPTPLKSERPLPPRPRVPRPDPRPVKVLAPKMSSRPSGRFYLQVAGASDDPTFQELRGKVSKFARIVDSGKGTAGSPDAAWVEIAIRGNAGDLIASLRTAELKEAVEKVIEVAPGEGRLLARQCDLYSIQRTKPVDSGE